MRPSQHLAQATDWSVYFITDTAMAGGVENVPKQVQRAIAGGVRVVQVRDKEMKDREFCALVSAVQRAATQEADRLGVCVRVFVNDRVMIAKELGCHVHIGQEDMPPAQVREIVGEDAIIGLSVHTRQQAICAAKEGVADVLGIGPVWHTDTKVCAAEVIGPAGAAGIAGAVREFGVKTVAVGGISARNASYLRDCGLDGLCVVSMIAKADDPAQAARSLRAKFLGV